MKRLEKEWKDIYPIVKEYDKLLLKYNREHKENRIPTFQERTGYILTEEADFKYFDY